jgi:hypothetical protein
MRRFIFDFADAVYDSWFTDFHGRRTYIGKLITILLFPAWPFLILAWFVVHAVGLWILKLIDAYYDQ